MKCYWHPSYIGYQEFVFPSCCRMSASRLRVFWGHFLFLVPDHFPNKTADRTETCSFIYLVSAKFLKKEGFLPTLNQIKKKTPKDLIKTYKKL